MTHVGLLHNDFERKSTSYKKTGDWQTGAALVEDLKFFDEKTMQQVKQMVQHTVPWETLLRIPTLVAALVEALVPGRILVRLLGNPFLAFLIWFVFVSDVVIRMLFPLSVKKFLSCPALVDVLAEMPPTTDKGWRVLDPVVLFFTVIVSLCGAHDVPTWRCWISIIAAAIHIPVMTNCYIDGLCLHVSKKLVEKMHSKICGREERIQELLPQLLLVRSQLEALWAYGVFGFVLVLLWTVIPTVICAVASLDLLARAPASALVMASVGFGLAIKVIVSVHSCAQISDSCMSTNPEGLRGALLLRSAEVATLSEKDIFSLMQMQHLLQICKMGARLGVVVDRTLLGTVIASTAASFGHIALQAVHELTGNSTGNSTSV